VRSGPPVLWRVALAVLEARRAFQQEQHIWRLRQVDLNSAAIGQGCGHRRHARSLIEAAILEQSHLVNR